MPFNPQTGVYEPDWPGTTTDPFDVPSPIQDWLPQPLEDWTPDDIQLTEHGGGGVTTDTDKEKCEKGGWYWDPWQRICVEKLDPDGNPIGTGPVPAAPFHFEVDSDRWTGPTITQPAVPTLDAGSIRIPAVEADRAWLDQFLGDDAFLSWLRINKLGGDWDPIGWSNNQNKRDQIEGWRQERAALWTQCEEEQGGNYNTETGDCVLPGIDFPDPWTEDYTYPPKKSCEEQGKVTLPDGSCGEPDPCPPNTRPRCDPPNTDPKCRDVGNGLEWVCEPRSCEKQGLVTLPDGSCGTCEDMGQVTRSDGSCGPRTPTPPTCEEQGQITLSDGSCGPRTPQQGCREDNQNDCSVHGAFHNECINNRWVCVPDDKPPDDPGDPPGDPPDDPGGCRPENEPLCSGDFHSECINGQWACVPDAQRAQDLCELNNGTWDERTQSCITDDESRQRAKDVCNIYGGNWNEETRSCEGDWLTGIANLDPAGELPFDPESLPILPGDLQDIYTQPIAADPLSLLSNRALENVIRAGGVASTPFTAQTEDVLSRTMADRGYAPPTPQEESLAGQFEDVIRAGGQLPPTPLEAETQASLRDIVAAGGALPIDQQRRAMEIEAARSPIDILRQSQLEQGQAAMAGRGLLGQGPELDYMGRLEAQLAPMYTQAAQEIQLEEQRRADTRYQNALAGLNQQAMQQGMTANQRYQATQQLQTEMTLDMARRQDDRLGQAIQQSANLTTQQSANLVNTVNALAGIQRERTDAAIRALDQNMEWNMFLAQFGLERDQVMEQLEQGRLAMLLPLIQEFMGVASQAAMGFKFATP
jgi:hypothetical protein